MRDFADAEYGPTPEFHFMRGATIQNVGLVARHYAVEGGLMFDLKMQDGSSRRVIIGATELGMWVEWDSNRNRAREVDLGE